MDNQINSNKDSDNTGANLQQNSGNDNRAFESNQSNQSINQSTSPSNEKNLQEKNQGWHGRNKTQKAKKSKSQDFVFSESYENNLKESLIKRYGVAGAEIILKSRSQKYASIEDTTGTTDTNVTATESNENMETGFQSKEKKPHFSKAGKVAAACLVVFIAGGCVTMSVDALRIPILNFFSTSKGQYSVVTTETDPEMPMPEREAIDTAYIPGKVVEGYKEEFRRESKNLMTIIYSDENGQQYSFTQGVAKIESWLSQQEDFDEKRDADLGTYYTFNYNEGASILWSFDGYTFILEGNIPEEELVNVADTLIIE